MTSDERVVDVSQDWESACDLQRRFMQGPVPAAGGLDCAARCRQMLERGGDCYDFVPLSDNRLAVSVGDASGKGLAAALMISTIQSSLRMATFFTGNDGPAMVTMACPVPAQGPA